jgi:pimeloyl-ACP methyl ester carboxylesterase
MAAFVHGVFFGRIAPPASRRRRIDAPALVVGHPRDRIHPLADAEMLAAELPDSTFVRAKGIGEWRFSPERLDQAAVEFCERVATAGAPSRLQHG